MFSKIGLGEGDLISIPVVRSAKLWLSNKIDPNIKVVANSLDKLSTKIQELDFPENHDSGKLIGDFGNSLVTFTDSAGDSIREIYSTIFQD